MQDSRRRTNAGFLKRWARATAASAAVVSLADALLLQQSRSYFTGGFLADDYLQHPHQVVAFLAGSLLVDAAFIGSVAALAAWLLARRLHARAAMLAGILLGAGSLLAADVVSYEIVRYLGDAFDLGLMFDLTGRRVDEVLAVSSDHLVLPLLAGGVVVLAGAGAVVLVHRRSAAAGREPAPRRALAIPVLLMLAGVAGLTIACTSSDVLENGLLRKPAGRALALAANAITDVDRDGYGLVSRMADPDPFDAAIRPYAVDRPGNGIDENGVGGDLPAGYVVPEPAMPGGPWQQRPDVVLVVLESFRADVVGLRHDGTPVTPVLDGLAARGVAVEHAYSHNGYTVQSRHHLFTGSLAAAPRTPTLIDDFKANGYFVAYVSGQDESFGGPDYDVGFSRADVAFDARRDRARRYSTSTTPGSLAVPLQVVQERVEEALRRPRREAPLFLVVSFHDTHFPYAHEGIDSLVSATRLPRARIAPGARAELWATYANTAANVDRAIGRVLAAVEHVRGAAPGVIVTADHGESLFDEGFLGHGYAINEHQTRIPLVVANLPVEIPDPFGQSDLRRAIAEGLSRPPSQASGPRLVPNPDREVFQYLGDLARPRQIAFLTAGRRLIWDFRAGRVHLPDGGSHRPRDLPPASRDAFVRLVHFWEGIHLARKGGGDPPAAPFSLRFPGFPARIAQVECPAAGNCAGVPRASAPEGGGRLALEPR